MGKVCATGMNSMELVFNDQLTGGFKQQDLNNDPTLPYEDNSFDVVTCVVSIGKLDSIFYFILNVFHTFSSCMFVVYGMLDYLVEPIKVLKEVHRVLRKGGKVIISQSNRCFPSKAISMWLKMNDRQHLELINGYLQYAGGFEEPRKAFDISATLPDNSYRDPMFIVEAIKA
jgi:SAM-dependent methyltransferase